MDLKVVLYYVLRVHVKQREAVNTLVKFLLVCLLREGQNRWKGSTANPPSFERGVLYDPE